MAKVGLKDVLALRAAGYSKKEIDALAAIDEENEKEAEKKEPETPAPEEDKKAQDDAADKESNPEPDYKALYEEQLKKTKEAEEKTKKLQQDNVHKNSADEAAEIKAKQSESLLSMVRDFM